MKILKVSGFAVGADMVRPIVFYTLDKWARRLLLVGEVFSLEIQYHYAACVLNDMIQDELSELLAGIIVPTKIEALKRKVSNVKTFTGQKQEWHVHGRIRELKRQILRAMVNHEDLYNFYASYQRDVFWQEFSKERQFRRLMGLIIVSMHVRFTSDERTRFIANLANRINCLFG